LEATNKRRTIRVIFIRHGQSVWNSLFNQFGLKWPIRLTTAVIAEAVYFLTQPLHSLIIDSPLSAKGRAEAEELADYMRSRVAQDRMPFTTANSVVVASNLRRAMETAVIGVAPRLSRTREKIVIDSSLQEGTRNIDGLSFSSERGKIAQTRILNFDTALMLHTVFDPSLNEGNKPLSSNVYTRMDDFIGHMFGGSIRPLSGQPLKEIIVVGHSGFFMRFFRRFLPPMSTHVAKSKKMKNCSVVAFELVCEPSGDVHIDESTVEVLHRGF
jgi:broad specificity phosphatase PhoE